MNALERTGMLNDNTILEAKEKDLMRSTINNVKSRANN